MYTIAYAADPSKESSPLCEEQHRWAVEEWRGCSFRLGVAPLALGLLFGHDSQACGLGWYEARRWRAQRDRQLVKKRGSLSCHGLRAQWPIRMEMKTTSKFWLERVRQLLMLSALMGAAAFAAGAAAVPDAWKLWQAGALRGANVMQEQCTLEDLAVLRSWGANLAEIPVSNVYAPTPPYGFEPENLKQLDRAVAAAEQAHLFIALTCREGPGRADFNRSHEIWKEEAAQEAYAKMWRAIAEHYRGRASILGYDLMCEPHPDDYANKPLGDWNALAKKITAAIREVDLTTPILVNSIGWAYPQTFDVLQPTGDPRTVYTVHFYDPHYYTHQKPADKVGYPGFRVPGKSEVVWDKAALEAKLAPVRAFQQKHHVPIFVGEFGCARYAPGVEDWMRDQLNLYEQYGWSWAWWAFREWDVMNIERTADPADKVNHSDAPLLKLFEGYLAKDKSFPSGDVEKNSTR